jgi:hypothetical protein
MPVLRRPPSSQQITMSGLRKGVRQFRKRQSLRSGLWRPSEISQKHTHSTSHVNQQRRIGVNTDCCSPKRSNTLHKRVARYRLTIERHTSFNVPHVVRKHPASTRSTGVHSDRKWNQVSWILQSHNWLESRRWHITASSYNDSCVGKSHATSIVYSNSTKSGHAARQIPPRSPP